MTRKETERRNKQEAALLNLGFTTAEAESLRRISMTLHRWHELECGNGNGCIERDEQTSRPMWHNSLNGRMTPIADRETGAQKRLKAIMRAHHDRQTPSWPEGKAVYPNPLSYYIQTDPRGAALYIIRPGDVPQGQSVESYYTRGIVVY